jgi:hypothetical protein
LFFNFAVSFDFGCCLLAQEMSFVDCYLPYFRQQLITGLLSALLPFQPLFTESSNGDQLLVPPPFSGALPALLSPVLCASFQFIIYSFCCCCWRGWSICPEGYAGLSQGDNHMMLAAHLFGLPNVSQAGLELVSGSSGGSPPVFSM